jgi:PBSX family phage portal protein
LDKVIGINNGKGSEMPQTTSRRVSRSARPQETNVRTTIFKVERKDDSMSRQVEGLDEFGAIQGSTGELTVLSTPFNVYTLFRLIDQSNMIRQCIDAYCTNTVMTGWEVDGITRDRLPNDTEKNELQSFIDHANVDESLATVMELVVRDRESVGFGFLEIVRDISGEISVLRHAKALHTRLCNKHMADVEVSYTIPRGLRVTTVTEVKKFRRFAQRIGGTTTYFREFGDPRRMDYKTGAFEGEQNYSAANQATEILHFKNPSNEAYGTPRWINQLPNIIGSREAEEVNMRYFQDNTVPPMMLTVSNGRLTLNSYRELTKALNETDIGAARQNKIMLIEAVGEGDSIGDKASNVTLNVEKLTDSRQSDGLFKQYDEGNMAKVRSSFRLPPVTVGMSQDVNFATANVSAFIAESQVFAPARQQIDEMLNKQLVNGLRGLNMRSCKVTSRTPSITSPDMVVKTLTALNVMGAVTPRSAQLIANKMLQVELPQYPKKGEADYDEWMDLPIIFAKATPGGAMEDPTASGQDNLDQQDGTDDPNSQDAITPTTGSVGTTHAQQALKTPEIKKTEKTGKVSASKVKNGLQ